MENNKINKEFTEASVEMKRVIIAKDVIKQIIANKFKAETGKYMRFTYDGISMFPDSIFRNLVEIKGRKECELQEIIQDENIKCRVCALGSCFLSLINLNDNYKLNEDISYILSGVERTQHEIAKVLSPYFSISQLRLMENTFEANDLPGYIRHDCIELNGIELTDKAMNFGSVYIKDNDRLIAIMQNIIDNNGEFKP